MSVANEVELLMLELINEERTSRGLDPLEINTSLNAAAEDHSQWMLEADIFNHTGAGGSTSRERIEAADYALEGSWATAENIGWQSERGAPGIADDVADIHTSLMNSPGHRANILDPELEDIGIGVEQGRFATGSGEFNAVMVTQNFGRSDAVSEMPQADSAPLVTSSAPTEPLLMPALVFPQGDQPPATSPEQRGMTPLEPATPALITESGTTTSSVTSVATAGTGPDGTFIETDVQITGNGSGTATGTVGDETETTSLTSGTPTTTETTPTLPTFDFADFFDFRGFGLHSERVQEDTTAVETRFAGVLTTPEGTVTTNDPAEFNSLLTDMFAGTTMTAWDGVDFL